MGFPLGVTIDNILTVNSTPRNRLLADILLKTGVVERSGQGVDKLFKNTIQESKGSPDYTLSDNFQVHLHIPTVVQDKAFVLFIEHIQQENKIDLSLAEVLTLEKIRQKAGKNDLDKNAVKSLLEKELIEPVGRTNTKGYMFSKAYYTFTNQPAAYTKQKDPDLNYIWLQVHNHISKFRKAKIADFELLFNNTLTREQVKYYIYLLEDLNILARHGIGKGTFYELSSDLISTSNPMQNGLDKLNSISNPS
ncbi:MAG: hypothetical protein K2X48_00465 [Chitinophagaceae bacterium]|nr:hypothetical protein [Chitinophagaceae bacterium]